MNKQAALLMVLNGEEKGKTFLVSSGVTIGRGDDNDVVIRDKSISRHHARIEPAEDGRFVVTDMGSKNRITFEGATVRRCEISLEQEFMLGKIRMKLVSPAAEEEDLPPEGANLPAPAQPRPAAEKPPKEEIPLEIATGVEVERFFEEADQKTKKGGLLLLVLLLAIAAITVYVSVPLLSDESIVRLDVTVYEGKDKALAVWNPAGRPVSPFKVKDPQVAKVKVDSSDGFLLKISGLTRGITTASAKNASGGETILTIVVKVCPDIVWEYQSAPDEKKKIIAANLISQARDVQTQQPYTAMQLYRRVAKILEDVTPRPREYFTAVQMEEKLQKEINKRLRNFVEQYRIAARSRRWDSAVYYLHEITKLIGDPEDYRYQKAKLYIMRLRRLQQEERKGRRTR